jgi:EpsI family protein
MNQMQSTRNHDMIVVKNGRRQIQFAGQPLTIRTTRLQGASGSIVAWNWYWLGDAMTASDAVAKFDLSIDRLLGRDDTSAWLTLYVVDPRDGREADMLLEAFAGSMGDRLLASLKAARAP